MAGHAIGGAESDSRRYPARFGATYGAQYIRLFVIFGISILSIVFLDSFYLARYCVPVRGGGKFIALIQPEATRARLDPVFPIACNSGFDDQFDLGSRYISAYNGVSSRILSVVCRRVAFQHSMEFSRHETDCTIEYRISTWVRLRRWVILNLNDSC